MYDEEDLRPEEGPALPEEPPLEEVAPVEEDDDFGPPPRTIDPAFAYVVLSIIALLGLGGLAPDVRYTLLWTILALVSAASLALDRDRIKLEGLNFRQLVIGVGIGAAIGLPIVGVGFELLAKLSRDIFVGMNNTAVFQALAFVIPFAEGLFFRASLQSVRSAVFTGLAAGGWMVILFLPQLDALRFPGLAVVLSLCFVFVNILYSYVRHRFGFWSSWACQVTMGLMLLFVSRFAG
jgi:hypothetical protein